MITQIADEDRLKTILREVLVEILDQRRDWFTAVVAEAMEDAVLVRAIKEGEDTALVKPSGVVIADFDRPSSHMVRRQQLQFDETIKQQARQRFERHFGTLAAENAGSAENEQIDADLAQADAA
jgi:hypothetical protein